MDTEALLLVQEIKLKVGRLLQQKNDLQKLVNQLTEAQQMLKEELVLQKNTNKELKEQNKIVKIAEALRQNDGLNKELEQTISNYIREIDDCIRLISDSKL